jgi:hypothetical protein
MVASATLAPGLASMANEHAGCRDHGCAKRRLNGSGPALTNTVIGWKVVSGLTAGGIIMERILGLASKATRVTERSSEAIGLTKIHVTALARMALLPAPYTVTTIRSNITRMAIRSCRSVWIGGISPSH